MANEVNIITEILIGLLKLAIVIFLFYAGDILLKKSRTAKNKPPTSSRGRFYAILLLADTAFTAVGDLAGDFRLQLSPVPHNLLVANIISLQHIVNKLLRIIPVSVSIRLAITPCIQRSQGILLVTKKPDHTLPLHRYTPYKYG